MGKSLLLASALLLVVLAIFGMGGLLVAWAIAPLIGVAIWFVARGLKWL